MSRTLTRDQAMGLDSDTGEYIPLDARSIRPLEIQLGLLQTPPPLTVFMVETET